MRPKHLEQFKEEYQEKGYCQIREFFSASEIKRIEETLESAKDKSEVSKEKVTKIIILKELPLHFLTTLIFQSILLSSKKG